MTVCGMPIVSERIIKRLVIEFPEIVLPFTLSALPAETNAHCWSAMNDKLSLSVTNCAHVNLPNKLPALSKLPAPLKYTVEAHEPAVYLPVKSVMFPYTKIVTPELCVNTPMYPATCVNDLQLAVVSIAKFPELLSNMTSSERDGTVVTSEPPEVSAHEEAALQLPVFAYFVAISPHLPTVSR